MDKMKEELIKFLKKWGDNDFCADIECEECIFNKKETYIERVEAGYYYNACSILGMLYALFVFDLNRI